MFWFYVVFLNLILFPSCYSFQDALDSLEKNYHKFDSYTQVKTLLAISAEYLRDDPEKSLKYSKNAYNIAQNLKNDTLVSESLMKIGMGFYYLNSYDTALIYYYQSIDFQKKLKDYKGLGNSYNDIGIIFKNKGNYKKSLENHYLALEFREKSNDSINIARSFNNIGNVYYFLKDLDKALEFFSKGLEIKISQNDVKTISTSYNNLGMVYSDLHNYDEAIECYNKSLEYDIKNNYLRGISTSYNNLGNVYYDKKDYKKALDYYQKGYEIDVKINNIIGEAITLINIGSIYRDLKDYNKSIQYLNEAVILTKENEFNDLLKESYYFLYLSHKDLGNHKNALEAYENFIITRDSIFSTENANTIAELNLKYETEKKEKEIELLKKNQEISKSWNLAVTIAIIFIFLVLVLFIIFYRLKNKANKMLNEKNHQIENQNIELEQLNNSLSDINKELTRTNTRLVRSEESLQELNATRDKFFNIVAFDLRNSLSEFITSTDLMINYYDKLDKDKIISYLKKIGESSHKVNKIFDNLILWSRLQTNSIDFNPISCKLITIAKNAIASIEVYANEKNIEIVNEIQKDEVVFCDMQLILVSLRNIISNAIK